jgi:hypothetical protein
MAFAFAARLATGFGATADEYLLRAIARELRALRPA